MYNLYLIIGPSGSGKTTLADELCTYYEAKQVESFTDREPRRNGEKGHRFVTKNEFDKIRDKMVAYTEFDGHQYGVTKGLLDQSDFYVIDPDGAIDLIKHYERPNGNICVIWLHSSVDTRIRRMKEDGRSMESIASRIDHDRNVFDFGSYIDISLLYGMIYAINGDETKDNVLMHAVKFIDEMEENGEVIGALVDS